MAEVTATVLISAEPERVFDYFAQMEHVAAWMSEDFRSVRAESPGEPSRGARFRYETSTGAVGTWEIDEFERPWRLAWSGPPVHVGPGTVEGRGTYVLQLQGRETEVRTTVAPRFGGLLRLLGPLSRGQMRRKLPRQLERAKAAIEAVGT